VYTIKHAAARAGITVELLRAWERRYGIVEPIRTPAGYRLYDDDAIARIQAMRRLIGSGWSPRLAAQAVVEQGPSAADVVAMPEGTAPGVGLGNGFVSDQLAERFVAAAAKLDGEAVDAALDEMFVHGIYERVVDELVLPAVVELGEAWADGRISVAAEHAASHAVVRRLGAALEAAGANPSAAGAVMVGLPAGSRHDIGALAFAAALRRAGVPVVYLGADLPAEDWVSATREARAAVIGVVTEDDVPSARQLVAQLRSARPKLRVALGGRAAPEIAGCVRLPDLLSDAVTELRRVIS
jgi:MerR family transcriptional regulator, light-induced transcriptional regulator